MFVVLWEFEVKRGSEERFERVYGPGGDWTPYFAAKPSMPERTCSPTRHGRASTLLRTIGSRANPTRNFFEVGAASTTH
jgi:hypothetical protein